MEPTEKNTKSDKDLLIVSTDPSFLQRDIFWFSENKESIKRALLSDPFWQHNAVLIEKDKKIILSEFLRQLDELGYEKKYSVKHPGQFAAMGGIVEIFPVNYSHVFTIEFFGNQIEQIIERTPAISDKEREFFLRNKAKTDNNLLQTLKNGEYVTHLDHGIGLYQGQTSENNENYLIIHYAGPKEGGAPDRLLVPYRQIKKISRYLGFGTPTPHRLGSQIWQTTKRKAEENILKLAQELLLLYRRRNQARRNQYDIDDEWEKTVAQSFAHQETEDQLKALEDIKKDLSGQKPMDRLIVGEVGFGKTEVALRAALLAMANNYQVAFLCPTTILADQHYNNFRERTAKLPLNIGLLSRFEKKSDQKKTVEGIGSGAIDIVIGTHRLLSQDIRFKNLGLLIIDEEQRFGVKQKEKIKQLKSSIDILSLTATPIPRTLHLALAGLRDMSEITTAPSGRLAVKTIIGTWNKEVIQKAINEEVKNRNGQVYWLHNRIETIEKIRQEILEIEPGLKIVVGHGRMPEQQLRKIMREFREGKKDLLLATTIIENGLDLPNVNTLIVDDATRLGLAQAHQLRGRIGRSHEQAYAYFFHPKRLTEQSRMRLQALKDYSYLGAGLEIAKKDLEIRGAGNVLGREQSGTLNQIGLNLYCQMLGNIMEELQIKEI